MSMCIHGALNSTWIRCCIYKLTFSGWGTRTWYSFVKQDWSSTDSYLCVYHYDAFADSLNHLIESDAAYDLMRKFSFRDRLSRSFLTNLAILRFKQMWMLHSTRWGHAKIHYLHLQNLFSGCCNLAYVFRMIDHLF